MKLIKLTHANLDTPVEVSTHNIFHFYRSSANAATHVVAPGGAYFPVKESVEAIKALIKQTVSGGDTNGT